MGEAPISWQEMAAWERLTGIELEPWEARAIRAMSRAFVSMRFEAEKPSCPAPYNGDRDGIEERRDEIATKVRNVFKALAAQQAADQPKPPPRGLRRKPSKPRDRKD